jgi:glycosyltransferase involved in cell wall biosynthesis
LCVSHYFESHSGGIEMVAGQLARNLAATMTVNWAATDATPPPPDLHSLPLAASNIVETKVGLPFPLPGPRSLVRLFGAVRNSDAVLVHDGMYVTSIAAMFFARILGRPVLLVQHIGKVPADQLVLKGLFWIADRVTRVMMRLASQVIFISDTSARHFAAVRTARAPSLVFNGIDTSIYEPGNSSGVRLAERRALGWPKDRPVVLFVGRFLEKKGLLRLREMAVRRPNIHWAFAGWGVCDPGHWDLPNVTVHPGLTGSGIARLYRGADLLVLPSKSEGFPLVVQEALACGLRPICCTDGAEADPVAAGYVTGVSKDGSEEEVIRRYLAEIDAAVAVRETWAERTRRAAFAHQRYSASRAASQYAAIIDSLVGEALARQPRTAAAA